ncbi:hypothetical protein Q9Q99_03385 [Curtobacterium flaccumfaciens]|nr:hypothetical protein Q9Q99_03385 [Curtobacterium flaccumfaciens]
MPATRVPRVPAEERLFSLVLALLSTESGLTKAEILANVQGYRQRFSTGGDNASLERQFERDKDDVRELGIPLETIETPGAAGNNQTLRYRIPKGEYDLPVDVRVHPGRIRAAVPGRDGVARGRTVRRLPPRPAEGALGGCRGRRRCPAARGRRLRPAAPRPGRLVRTAPLRARPRRSRPLRLHHARAARRPPA